MNTRNLLLVEPFDNVVAANAPYPDEGRGECRYEEGWEQDQQGKAHGYHGEDQRTQKTNEKGGEQREDNDCQGHYGKKAKRDTAEGDLGQDEGLGRHDGMSV